MVFESGSSAVDNSFRTEFGSELIYDLRIIYAKLVGDHLEDIALARKADDYKNYFKALEDLHVIIRHKFKHMEKNDVEYKRLLDNAAKVANKYSSTFLGSFKDPDGVAEIEGALKSIEMFFYERMNEAAMFGSSKRIEGL